MRALAVFTRAARPKTTQYPKRIVNWLREHHAIEVEGKRRLPRELEFLQKTKGPGEKILDAVLVAIGWAVGLCIPALGWYWLWKEFDSPKFALVEGATLHNFWAILQHAGLIGLVSFGALLVLGLVLNLIPVLSKRFSGLSWIRSPLALEFKIETDADADKNRPMASPWQLQFRGRVYFVPTSPAQTVTKPASTESSYRALRQAATERMRESNRQVIRLLLKLRLIPDVRITVDSHSAAGPWEAVVGIVAVKDERFADVFGRFSRTVARRSASTQTEWPGQMNVTAWVYRGLGVDQSNLALGGVHAGGGGFRGEVLANSYEYGQEGFRTGVAHIFGLPVERSQEVFLGVGGVERGDVAYWISPTELVRQYPNMRLLIIQAPPAEIRERTPTYRLQSAQLKRFGARAFEAGIPAVLVLPSMPLGLAGAVITAMYEAINNNSRNMAYRLIVLTRRLQEMIGAYPHDSPDVPFELAFDVCLYVEAKVNFRSRAEQIPKESREDRGGQVK